MADPELLAINAKYVQGDKRRRQRKKVPKTLLPQGVIDLLTAEAQLKYSAYVNATEETEEQASSSADFPDADVDTATTSSAPEPQPGPSGNQPEREVEMEDDGDDDDYDVALENVQEEDLDNIVFVSFDTDEEDCPEPEEIDTFLGVKDLKRKSKSSRQKVAKIRILESSDEELEEN